MKGLSFTRGVCLNVGKWRPSVVMAPIFKLDVSLSDGVRSWEKVHVFTLSGSFQRFPERSLTDFGPAWQIIGDRDFKVFSTPAKEVIQQKHVLKKHTVFLLILVIFWWTDVIAKHESKYSHRDSQVQNETNVLHRFKPWAPGQKGDLVPNPVMFVGSIYETAILI